MSFLIIGIVLLAYLLIATEYFTHINKAAVAIFSGTLMWVLYVCYGTDFVMTQHPQGYAGFLEQVSLPNTVAVKKYIAQNVFLPSVGKAAEIVLYLLATMTIVEILNNNGCFDFVRQLLRTHNSKKMLWTLAISTFLISANLDNLTTTVMMLSIMRQVVQGRRQRMVYGSAIVLASNYGGALTVIGNPEGLLLWNKEVVTPTVYSLMIALPTLVAWILPTWWLSLSLPERTSTAWIALPYRGDDTTLSPWQRVLMLFVGIGGLWFVPTFHNITKLNPFLGAMCVLSVLWIVNELCNHKLNNTDQMIQRPIPRVLQYGAIQMILFITGLLLLWKGVLETGLIDSLIPNDTMTYADAGLLSVGACALSTVVDNFAMATCMFSLYGVSPEPNSVLLMQNGLYWILVTFAIIVGGNVLGFGSLSGLSLMKTERIHIGWYFKNVGYKVLVGGAIGALLLLAICSIKNL